MVQHDWLHLPVACLQTFRCESIYTYIRHPWNKGAHLILFSFNNPGNCIFSIFFLNQFLSAEHIKLKVLRYKLELMKCLIKHSKCRIVNIYCLSHFLVPFTSSFRQGCARKIFFHLSFICFNLFGLTLRVHIKYFTIFVL